jgi:ligand-binding sensor domain-containing protein
MREVLSQFWLSTLKLLNLFNLAVDTTEKLVIATDHGVSIVEREARNENTAHELRSRKYIDDLTKELGLND